MSKAASARGLFRATGNKTRKVVTDIIGGEAVMADGLPREADDFYPTPPEPTQALIAAEFDRLHHADYIWEPAAGDGAMVRQLAAAGLRCNFSDIVDRGCGAVLKDWFAFNRANRLGDAVVTNPPFFLCADDRSWVRHGLEMLDLDYMALLLPLGWMGAAKRAACWRDWPPARVYVMRWKIDFTGQGAPPMLNAWFVWDRRAAPGDPQLLMLDRPRGGATAELFGDAT